MFGKNKKLSIAFYWHMHQPFYKLNSEGDYIMPWVRLHAIKDYLDMLLIVDQIKLNHLVRICFYLKLLIMENT